MTFADRPMLTATLEAIGQTSFEVRHDYVGMEQELHGELMRLGLQLDGSRVSGFEHSLFGSFHRAAS